MNASGWFTAGALGLVLQGCAAPQFAVPVIPPYPAPNADNNALGLEIAIDKLVARSRLTGALYSFTQYSDKTVMQAQFDDVAMLRDFKNILQQNVEPTSFPSKVGHCIKHHVVQATVWDFQDRLRGKLNAVPRDPVVGGSIFSNTWNNVALYCGVQNPEILRSDVNEGWRRAATVINSIQFGRY